MKKTLRVISLILAIISLGMCAAACQNGELTDFSSKAYYDYSTSNTGKGTNIKTMYVEREIDSMKVEDFVASDKESDFVRIDIKNYGSIVVVLRHDVAPVSVANFKKLVSEKYYDGAAFHRVIEHFMIQGGGYIIETETNEDGVKNSNLVEKESRPAIQGEFDSNGFENNLYHVRGVLSMARTSVKNSASTQFFIIHETNEASASLNGDYAAFGYVLAGMDVVDAIAACQVFGEENAPIPVEDVIIESATFVEPKDKLW